MLWAIALGLTLAAVTASAVLTLFRMVQPLLPSTPDPASPSSSDPAVPPASSSATDPAASTDLRLPGVGPDVVYVQAAAAVYRVDLASGGLVRTLTPELTEFSSFVARPGWVVSKTVDNDSGVLIRDGRPAEPLPQGLHGTGRVYPAGPRQLWLLPEDATDGTRTAIKVDLDGQRVGTATITIPDEFGLPRSDHDGQLRVTNAGGAYRAGPDGLHRLGAGELLAIGTHHVLTWDCDDQARCNAYRTDRSTGLKTVLGVDRKAVLELYRGSQDFASTGEGVLSLDGTHAALGVPAQGADEFPLAVVDLRNGRHELLPGSMTDTNANAQVAWTANSRWLLALTGSQLRAYDTTTGTVRTLDIGGEPLQHLVNANAAGF